MVVHDRLTDAEPRSRGSGIGCCMRAVYQLVGAVRQLEKHYFSALEMEAA
jgi:hypothetical protein